MLLITIDQWTKTRFKQYLLKHGSKRFKYFQLSYVENKGAALGFLKSRPKVLLLLSSILLVIVTRFLIEGIQLSSPLFYLLGLILIISGGLGNIIDRLRHGYVIDFFSFAKRKMPYFNLADMYIISGAVIWVGAAFIYDINI